MKPRPSLRTVTERSPAALVTGASSGIGRATALAFASRGHRLILLGRHRETLDAVAEEARQADVAVRITVDLSDAAALARCARQAARELGSVEILFNGAGFGRCVPFLEQDEGTLRRFMEVHYFAAMTLIRVCLPAMLERRRGHVINVASIATKFGPWGHGGYAAAKSAIVALTESLACEYANSGVAWSYVNPGIVRTPFFDHPSYQGLSRTLRRRAIRPEVVARRIVSLLDRPRLELCVPAHYRVVEWIKALSPSLAWRLVARSSRPAGPSASG